MNINNASAKELEEAFQVDGTRARYIIEERTKRGGFKNWDEVKEVPGFEDKMVENLQKAGLRIGPREERASGDANRRSGREQDENARAHRPDRAGRGMDMNTASAEELESVFQIDGERAHYLVDARKRLGRFQSWEQIKSEVPSFDEGMVENLKKAGARIG